MRLGLIAVGLSVLAHLASAQQRPNVIWILTDDQGYGDLSCHGNPVLRTPNLDRLHADSVRFTNFHVSPTCSPTRAALLTGRHEFKNGVTHTIYERERLCLSAVTLAQVLRDQGYATGIFGKWHLGDEEAYRPDRRGFEEVFIHGGGGIGQTYPGSCGDAPGNTYFDPAILHNNRFVKTNGYCTDVFFRQALDWINQQRHHRPFFAYIATNTPHAPLQVPERYSRIYTDQVPEQVAKFYGMIVNIDENVGRLLDQLHQWGIERNTLVIFMTDNGGTLGGNIYNAGMRGQKGTPWLGGTRAVSFWRWPGRWQPAEVSALTAHIDVFPTLIELTGSKMDERIQRQVEGRSLVPLLANPRAPWPDRILVTHVGRWPRGEAKQSKYRQVCVRNTQYTLVCTSPTGQRAWELYEVIRDPGQKNNIITDHPDVAKELENYYDRWWESILPCLVNEDALGPPVNPFKELYWKQFGKP
ncbi:MAG: arylsulfatase [Gemmatales bacterium]|nr:arylsulfatase [Gemmatales bacterium]MDW8176389.1 arylsulfatase [Gemmatales bacterium]